MEIPEMPKFVPAVTNTSPTNTTVQMTETSEDKKASDKENKTETKPSQNSLLPLTASTLCDQAFTSSEDLEEHKLQSSTTIMPVTPHSSEDELSYFEKFMSHAKTAVAAATSSSQKQEEKAQEQENRDTPMDTSTAETEFESLEAALAVDVNAPNVMIQSPPENDHLVNNDSTPVSYPAAEAMLVDEPMTDEDGNSAAAIVDFEMGQQQKQQHLQDAALDDSEPKAKPVVKNDIEKHSFQCTQCDKSYPYRKSLNYHMHKHTGTRRSYQCDRCGKFYVTLSSLRGHLMMHTDERPYLCDVCGKGFRHKGDLGYHMSSLHSNIKPFHCEYCEYVCARKYSLDVHIRKHTAEKKYKCGFCDLRFSTASYRLTHQSIHTGEKNHKCEVCGKCFRIRSGLKRHREIHNKKPTTSTGRRSKAQCSTQESTSRTNINDDTTEEIYHLIEVEEEEENSEEIYVLVMEEASPEINGTLYVMISRRH